jgi:hypothetical protein
LAGSWKSGNLTLPGPSKIIQMSQTARDSVVAGKKFKSMFKSVIGIFYMKIIFFFKFIFDINTSK